MGDYEIERLILERFSMKTARTKGGLSPAMIRGGKLKKADVNDVDRALTRMRKGGGVGVLGWALVEA